MPCIRLPEVGGDLCEMEVSKVSRTQLVVCAAVVRWLGAGCSE